MPDNARTAAAAFLQEIEAWRETLARNIALHNAALTQRQLNVAVQVTIDRIIFLRMCEDRGIEDYGRLMALLNGDCVYDRLMGLFREADQRYNSGLFHFQREKGRPEPDTLTPDLTIDDRILKEIIKGLYYPDSPYEFSVLPADILGHVYEQFLGKVIRLTRGHHAKVEQKPEVRKAGGVYYTPTYIVQYIVKHTVGRLLDPPSPPGRGAGGEGRTVKWITREKGKAVHQPRLDQALRVLDPACGSGSFLLGAYQYLLDWYLDYYTAHDPESWARKRNPPIYLRGALQPSRPVSGRTAAARRGSDPDYRLTVAERKRILLEHIFGVDIDPQAVEVTKLSLLLKVLEGETAHSLGTHLWYEKERALPDLATNIKCGNSLIGPDFYDTSGRQMDMFDEEERLRINVFDWAKEFPQVFQPSHSRDLAGRGARGSSSRGYQRENSPGFDAVIGNPPYLSFSGRQAVELSDKERSYFSKSYQSAGWMTSHGLFIERAVKDLSARFTAFIVPDQVGHLQGYEPVRETISRYSSLVEVRYWGEGVFEGVVTPALTFVADTVHRRNTEIHQPNAPTCRVRCQGGEAWTTSEARGLLLKLRRYAHSLSQLVADPGVHTGNCSKKLILPVNDAVADCVPVLEGKQVSRYRCDRSSKLLNLQYHAEPGEYFTIRAKHKYTDAPFVIRQTAAYPIVGPREHADYFRNSLLALYRPKNGTDVRYLVGLLNSRLMRYAYSQMVHESQQKAFPQVKVRSLRELPIRTIGPAEPKDKALHDLMVEAVQVMLTLQRQLSAARTADEKQAIHRQVNGIDRRIDDLVYDLYGLTDDEIKIVEEATEA